MNRNDMLEGAPWRSMLRFAMPVLAGLLIQQLYNTVDTIVLGNFASQDALAAVGTTGTFVALFLALATGFSAGNGVVVAQRFGARDERQMRIDASTGILLVLGMGILASVVSFAVSRVAFERLVHVPQELIDLTLRYFLIYVAGLVFQFGYNIYASILRAVGDSASTLYFLLAASALNVALDLLFVARFQWGVTGAAVATDIAQAVAFVAALAYASRNYPVFRFKLGELVWDTRSARATVVAGLPIALQMAIVSLGQTFIQRAVNEFGKQMTASFTVGQRIENYAIMPCNAFQTTLATFTGQNIGAGRMDRVKLGARQAVLLSLVVTAAISACIWVFAPQIIELFAISDQAAEYCLQHLRTSALIYLILAAYVPVFGLFQGTNHAAIVTFVALAALTTRVAVTYLLRYGALFGHTIVWWNGLFGFGVGFSIAWGYYLSGRWKRGARIET